MGTRISIVLKGVHRKRTEGIVAKLLTKSFSGAFEGTQRFWPCTVKMESNANKLVRAREVDYIRERKNNLYTDDTYDYFKKE